MNNAKKLDLDEIYKILTNLPPMNEEILSKVYTDQLNEKWEEIMGPIFYLHTEAGRIKKNNLEIIADHPAYTMEVDFLKKTILKNCNNFFKDINLKSISIKVGLIKNKPPKKKSKTKSLIGKENLLELLEKEADPKIKKKLFDLVSVLE
jgi:hypothetical protein